MDLKSTVQSEMKVAMKAQDALSLSTLRMLLSEIKKREIDSKAALSETDSIKLVQSMIKQRNDSVEAFTKGARPDLAEKEKREIEILKRYLPQQLTPEAVSALVAECIRESGASRPEDMGKVMKLIVVRAAGRADGKLLNEAVRAQLAKATS